LGGNPFSGELDDYYGTDRSLQVDYGRLDATVGTQLDSASAAPTRQRSLQRALVSFSAGSAVKVIERKLVYGSEVASEGAADAGMLIRCIEEGATELANIEDVKVGHAVPICFAGLAGDFSNIVDVQVGDASPLASCVVHLSQSPITPSGVNLISLLRDA